MQQLKWRTNKKAALLELNVRRKESSPRRQSPGKWRAKHRNLLAWSQIQRCLIPVHQRQSYQTMIRQAKPLTFNLQERRRGRGNRQQSTAPSRVDRASGHRTSPLLALSLLYTTTYAALRRLSISQFSNIDIKDHFARTSPNSFPSTSSYISLYISP
jgi:hypothetical protein